jgi:hypothetical protein
LARGLRLRFLVRSPLPAPSEFSLGFHGSFSAGVGVGGPSLIPGVAGLELFPFGGYLPGESAGAGYASVVVPGLGVGGLGERVSFGLRGEP